MKITLDIEALSQSMGADAARRWARSSFREFLRGAKIAGLRGEAAATAAAQDAQEEIYLKVDEIDAARLDELRWETEDEARSG